MKHWAWVRLARLERSDHGIKIPGERRGRIFTAGIRWKKEWNSHLERYHQALPLSCKENSFFRNGRTKIDQLMLSDGRAHLLRTSSSLFFIHGRQCPRPPGQAFPALLPIHALQNLTASLQTEAIISLTLCGPRKLGLSCSWYTRFKTEVGPNKRKQEFPGSNRSYNTVRVK